MSFGSLVVAGLMHGGFIKLVNQDRQKSVNHIDNVVQSGDRAKMDQFELTFLRHSTLPLPWPQRIRSLELYAYFKAQQALHYGEFQGFVPINQINDGSGLLANY
jgi:hypothetical protein